MAGHRVAGTICFIALPAVAVIQANTADRQGETYCEVLHLTFQAFQAFEAKTQRVSESMSATHKLSDIPRSLRRTGCNDRPPARGCGGIAGRACIGWRPARPAPPPNDPAGCRAGVHRTLACKCHCSRYFVNRVTFYQELWVRLQVGVWQGPGGAHGQTTRLMRMPHMLLLGYKFVPVKKIAPN